MKGNRIATPPRVAPHARPLLAESTFSPSVKPQLAFHRSMAYAPRRNSTTGITSRTERETRPEVTLSASVEPSQSLIAQTTCAFRPKHYRPFGMDRTSPRPSCRVVVQRPLGRTDACRPKEEPRQAGLRSP